MRTRSQSRPQFWSADAAGAAIGGGSTAVDMSPSTATANTPARPAQLLHGVVVEPLVRGQLDLADYRAAVERGKQRSVDTTFDEYAIR